MPKKTKTPTAGKPSCSGGNSFACRQIAKHDQGKKKSCFRCDTYLGCSICAQIDEELICLNCDKHLSPPGNWATSAGMLKHGKIIRDPAITSEAWNIIKIAGAGRIKPIEIDLLFKSLFKSLFSLMSKD